MPQNSPTINVLLLAVNPKDTQPLNLSGEYNKISQILRDSDNRETFLLEQRERFGNEELIRLLNVHRPHILHFSGHGTPDHLLLQDDSGKAWPLTKQQLRDILRSAGNTVRIVVLNACYTDSLAEHLAEQVDCVIGMSSAVSDRTALKFSEGLYQALFHGLDVRRAFDQAMTLLSLGYSSGTHTPILRCRPGLSAQHINPLKWLKPNESIISQITSAQLSRLLSSAYPLISDFDDFVQNNFPDIYSLYDDDMSRIGKTSFLLEKYGQSEKLFLLLAPFRNSQQKYRRSVMLILIMLACIIGTICGYFVNSFYEERKATACYDRLGKISLEDIDSLINEASCALSKTTRLPSQEKAKQRLRDIISKMADNARYTEKIPERISRGEARELIDEISKRNLYKNEDIVYRLELFDQWLRNSCDTFCKNDRSSQDTVPGVPVNHGKTKSSNPQKKQRKTAEISAPSPIHPTPPEEDHSMTVLEKQLESLIAQPNKTSDILTIYHQVDSAEGNQFQKQRTFEKIGIYFCKEKKTDYVENWLLNNARISANTKERVKAACKRR